MAFTSVTLICILDILQSSNFQLMSIHFDFLAVGMKPALTRVFPDSGLRVSDSQNAVCDSLTKTWGVAKDPQNGINYVIIVIHA